MITRLTMKDFRGIVQGDVKDFAQVNILLGPNNAGKTTILEALYLAATADIKGSLNIGDDSLPVTTTAEKDLLGWHPMSRIWQRHNFSPHWVESPATWKSGEIHFNRMPKPLSSWNVLHSPHTEQGAFEQGQEELLAVLRLKAMHNQEPIPKFVTDYFGEQTADWANSHVIFMWEPNFTFRRNGIAAWIVEGDIPSAANTLLYDFHTTHAHFPKDFVDRGYTQTYSWLRKTAKSFAQVFDLPDDPEPYVTFMPYQLSEEWYEVLVEQYGRMVPLDTWGDGSRHVLKVLPPLIMLSDAAEKGTPGLALWEEPEIFLHPHTLHRMMREVLLIIKDKPVQLFITTQNIELIASLAQLVGEMEDISPNILRAFQLELPRQDQPKRRMKDGHLVAIRYKYDNLTFWLDQGLDPRYTNIQRNRLSLEYSLRGVE